MADKTISTSAEKPASEPAVAPSSQDRIKTVLHKSRRALAEVRRKISDARGRTAAMARPALEKTVVRLRKTGQHGAAVFGSLWHGRLLPLLSRSRRWLTRRLHPRTLARDYRRFLLLVHRLGPDRAIERLCFVRTSQHVPLSVVRVPHRLRRSGHDYRPTPRLVFKWAMEALPEPVERYQFVDYGAGRGRVLLMASHFPFERIVGAEIAEELYKDCLLNIAQYPRSLMKCRNVDCLHLSAMRLPVPEEETVFFFNNPFDAAMLERIVGQIEQSYKQEPRRFYIVCVDVDAREVFTDTGIFEDVPVSWRLRLKTTLFSPYSIALYRTLH